ncbi:MAG: hypothetical protein H0X41_11420 [Chitinophagaceae bacterium]|nr:hypothetical protein [Chitinophagaceae bacterium]
MSTTSISKKILVEKNAGAEIINSVKIFFGIKISATYNKSRIIRRPTKSYEEFIFKGYDQQRPGLLKPGSFKKIRLIGKN